MRVVATNVSFSIYAQIEKETGGQIDIYLYRYFICYTSITL